MQDRLPPNRRSPLATHGRTIHRGHFRPGRTPQWLPPYRLALPESGHAGRRSADHLGHNPQRRVVRRAGSCRLPEFHRALSRPLQTGAAAYRDTRLRCDRAECGAGENPRRTAVLSRGSDQPVGFFRHQRAVQIPCQRHQRARTCGAARHAVGRADHFTRTAQLYFGNLGRELTTSLGRRPRESASLQKRLNCCFAAK